MERYWLILNSSKESKQNSNMNKTKRVIGAHNSAVILLVLSAIYTLIFSDPIRSEMALLCGLSVVGYMVWQLQIVVIRPGHSISSLYPFRLRSVTIAFEDISKVSFSGEDYGLGNGAVRIDSRYLKAGVKSVSGAEIKFSETGFDNFGQLARTLPLSAASVRELDDVCREQAKHNFLRVGDLTCCLMQVIMILAVYSFVGRNVWFFVGLSMFLIGRMVVQQVKYSRERISGWDIASQRIESGIVRGAIIATVVMVLMLLKSIIEWSL